MKWLLLVWLIFLVCSNGNAVEISVYTTSYLPIANSHHKDVTLYHLDAPKKPLAALSKGLPDNYKEAVPQAVAIMNSPEGKRLLGELKRSYQGILSALSHRLTDLPAIVVDGQYIVYGVYDVNEALQLVESHVERL